MRTYSKIVLSVAIAAVAAIPLYVRAEVSSSCTEESIPVLVALSGEDSVVGREEEAGATLAVASRSEILEGELNKTNCKPLEILDTRSNAENAIAVLDKVSKNRQRRAVVGLSYAETAAMTVSKSESLGIFVFSPNTVTHTVRKDPYRFENLISLRATPVSEAKALLAFLKKEKFLNPALLIDTNDLSTTALDRAFEENGKGYDYKKPFLKITSSSSAQMKEELLRRVDEKIDAIVILEGRGTRASDLIALAQTDFPSLRLVVAPSVVERLSGVQWAKNPQLVRIETRISDPEFSRLFLSRYGRRATAASARAFDAVNLVLEARRHGALTSEDFRRYFNGRNFSTASYGTTRFNEFGAVTNAQFIAQSADGTVFEIPKQ